MMKWQERGYSGARRGWIDLKRMSGLDIAHKVRQLEY